MHLSLTAELAFGSDLAGHTRDFRSEGVELIHPAVDRVLQLQDFALYVHRDLLREVAVGHGRGHIGDVADLTGQVAGHEVDAVREVFPRSADSGHLRLTAQFSVGADLTGDARHLGGERVELVNHPVDSIFKFENLAAHIHRDLLRQAAVSHGRSHFSDVAHLAGQVAGHGVYTVGQVFPGPANALHVSLTAEPAFGSDLAGHARDFRSERVELVNHAIDRVLQLQEFGIHFHRDLLREFAVGHGRGHLGDVADLSGQVAGHRVDVVGQIFPRAGHVRHLRLTAELAFGSDLAGDARHLGGERVELIHHHVDRVLQLQDFALHIDGDLLRQITFGYRRGHFGDVADLGGEVAGHATAPARQVLPGPAQVRHLRLTAEPAFGSDLAGHARDFRSERVELVNHAIDRVLQLQDFAFHVHRDLLREVAVGHGRGHLGDVADLSGQVAGHRVHAVSQILPRARDPGNARLTAELAFGSDLTGDARHLGGEGVELIHHHIDRVLQFQDFALHVDGDLLREVAVGHGRGHLSAVADLGGEVAAHRVDAVGQVFPHAADARDARLAAQFSFGSDITDHARHLVSERVELVNHSVDGVLQFQDFALHVHRDLLGKISLRHRRGHLGDVADLGRQVAGHEIDAVGKVLPCTGHAFDLGFAAQLAFGADFARHTRDFRGERAELRHHCVDQLDHAQEFALQRTPVDLRRHHLREIAMGHRADDARHFGGGRGQVVNQHVDRFDQAHPGTVGGRRRGALSDFALTANDAADPLKFLHKTVVHLDHVIERVGDLSVQSRPIVRQSYGKIAFLQCRESF